MNKQLRRRAIKAKRLTEGPEESDSEGGEIDIQPPYPEGDVLANCVCGSWPGGECLRCEWIPGEPHP